MELIKDVTICVLEEDEKLDPVFKNFYDIYVRKIGINKFKILKSRWIFKEEKENV